MYHYLTARRPAVYLRPQAEADLANPRAWDDIAKTWTADDPLPMVDGDGNFLIPHVVYGNVLVGIQPGRAPEVDHAAAHDNTVPPHPQYLAYYAWLQHVWQADVIVHIGTHGTLEFLKSKENAVSAHDFPDLMVGDVPHVYLYYAGNPAEALLARRRSHATIVSYQPPVMTPGGLHDQLGDLADMLASYRRSLSTAPLPRSTMTHARTTRRISMETRLPADVESVVAQLAGVLEMR